jgi:hypothetical protein
MNLDPLGLNGSNLDPLGLGAPEPPKADGSFFGKVKRFASENFGDGGVPGVEMGLPPEESKGLAKGVLSTGTGFLAAPVAGVGALISRPFRSLYAGKEENPISNTFNEIQNALTYQPKDKPSQKIAGEFGDILSWPMRKASEGWGLILDETGKALPQELPEVPYLRPLVGTIAEVSAMGAMGGKKAVSNRINQAKNAVSLKGVADVLNPAETPTIPVERFPMGPDAAKSAYNPYMAAELDKAKNAPLRLEEGKGFQLVDREKEIERWKADQEAEAAGVSPDSGLDPLGVYGKETKPNKTQQRIDSYSNIIADASTKFGVEEWLIRGVIEAESRGKSDALSPKGAKGLMQLLDGTAKDLGVLDSFNPSQNIYGGVKYLRQLLDRYNGNVEQALAAYNWGMGRVDALVKAGKFDIANLPKETQIYINRVLKNKGETRKAAEGSPYEGYREIGADEVLQPGADVKMDMKTGKNYVKETSETANIGESERISNIADEFNRRMARANVEGEKVDPVKVMEEVKNDIENGTKTEPPAPLTVEPDKVVDAKFGESLETAAKGEKPASIAKSIEAKAIEAGLIKDGFNKLAGFDPTTMKAQAEHAARVMTDIEKARSIVRGEAPLPEGLRGISLVKAMEEHLKTTKDPQMAYELANSPLAAEVSLAAQELSLTRGRELDSFAARVAQVKKARETAAKVDGKKVVDIKNGLKKKVKEVNLPKEELNWNKFLSQIQC